MILTQSTHVFYIFFQVPTCLLQALAFSFLMAEERWQIPSSRRWPRPDTSLVEDVPAPILIRPTKPELLRVRVWRIFFVNTKVDFILVKSLSNFFLDFEHYLLTLVVLSFFFLHDTFVLLKIELTKDEFFFLMELLIVKNI